MSNCFNHAIVFKHAIVVKICTEEGLDWYKMSEKVHGAISRNFQIVINCGNNKKFSVNTVLYNLTSYYKHLQTSRAKQYFNYHNLKENAT